MVKMDYKLDHEKGLVMFGFECNKEEDYESLDMLWQVLSILPDSRVAYVKTNRLVAHVKGLVSASD